VDLGTAAFHLAKPGRWLVLGDVHLPFHDRTTLELAVRDAKARRVVGVLLNGDTLDSHEISDHDKDPKAPRYVEEIRKGREFLAWLRSQFPRGEIVYKEGNHEDRLGRYIAHRAPALSGLEGVDLPSFLQFSQNGVQWVGDKRIVWAGKLPILHGHEYKGGGGGVSPARWLYLRARYVAMCGHFHRTSEHHDRNIRDRAEAAWSVGCACHLSPKYAPLNNWNHGFAFVDFTADGSFEVDNKRVLAGKVV
jgi:hypothetical protein